MSLPAVYRNLSRHEIRGAILGTLMGDSSIQMHGRNGRLQMGHSPKVEDYVVLKGEILKQVPGVSFSYGQYTNTDKRTGKVYPYVQARTTTHPLFTKMRERMYRPNKRINKGILESLTPLGIALWFMDDGHLSIAYNRPRYATDVGKAPSERSIQARNINLATHGFTEEENHLICRWLKERFDIDARVKNSKGFFIFMNTTNARKFVDIVRPYVLPVVSMRYKIDFRYSPKHSPGLLKYNVSYWIDANGDIVAREEEHERIGSGMWDFIVR